MAEQSNWRFCHKCDAIFFSGYGGDRCPAGDTHSGQGFNFVLPHEDDRFLPHNNPPGAGIYSNDVPVQMFRGFTANADYYGLPVRFLKVVDGGNSPKSFPQC